MSIWETNEKSHFPSLLPTLKAWKFWGGAPLNWTLLHQGKGMMSQLPRIYTYTQ